MKRIICSFFLLATGILLTGCGYNQAACTNGCGYAVTTSYVPTTSYVTTTTTKYVTPISYVGTTSYVQTTNCCPTCNRCGAAYTGYGSGYSYDYNATNTNWY